MQTKSKKLLSIFLCAVLICTMLIPGITSFSADITMEITYDGAPVTETLSVQEYRSLELGYTLSADMPDGAYVEWSSNQPLLAGVDSNGKVTGYDYSKAAIFQKWLDEDVRSTPVVGESMANAIESAIASAGIDIETADTNTIVALVRTIAGDSLADRLQSMLDNMTIEITATLFDANGNELATDTVTVIVEKSVIASVAPTGVHITNKNTVPTTVAVGSTVQLYGACTPVRLKQGIKWSMGSSALDSSSKNHATVSSDGLVTFTSVGEATVRVNPESTLYAAFSDTIKFTVVDPSELPVTDFTISGETKVNEGETTQLSVADLVPAGAYIGDIEWSSSDSSVAMVDQNGVVTGLDGGSGLTYSKTATIYAKIGEVTRSVTVTVSRSLIGSTISGVEISGDTAVGIGNTSSYTATITPSRLSSNSDVVKRWGVIDPVTQEKIYVTDGEATDGIGKIDSNGNFTGVSSGKSTIFVDAEYNGTVVTNTFEVIVGNAITDFAISGNLSVEEGATTQLSITSITPVDYDPALLETVVWTVENPSIAYVDENGVVTGLDGGAVTIIRPNTKTTTVTATVAGVSKSVQITVSSTRLNTYTGGYIDGPDAVVVDFPHTYTSVHSPARVDTSRQYWGIAYDDGQSPWGSTTNNSFLTSFDGNTDNSYASIDSKTALVTGKKAGTIEIWTYMARNLTSHQNLSRQIDVVELTPKSITITAPEKYEYLEGNTELDLTGLVVKITYDKNELAQYYPEAADWSEDQMTVEVTDYEVGSINNALLDNEQYIIVTVTRAGKEMRAIFPVLVKSKQVDTIDITETPRYQYLEGETELDLDGLKVIANYLNAESEEITNYTVNTNDFNPTILDVEQYITVTYTHAGRSASDTFPIIIYGIPVVNVTTEPADYSGEWTKDDITFTLDSTHQTDGITYYYKSNSDTGWTALSGNTLTVDTSIEETYYFKAVNGKDIESAETIGYKVSIDKVTPVFTITPETTDITNQSYNVTVNVGTIGASGIQSITLDGKDITGKTQFTVDENGTYTVKITTVSGLEAEESIVINNIDKTAPAITNITVEHKNNGGFARFINKITFGLFFNEAVEATITAEDYGVAGVDFIEYRYLDVNGDSLGDWAVYDENNKPSQDPDFKGYIEARVTDKATNVSDSYYSEGYVIDGTQPTDIVVTAKDADGLYVSDTWTSTNVTLELSSTAFSDVYMYYYSVDGGETWNEVDGNTITASAHGIAEYQFKAESYSALESAVTPFTVKIDKTQPVVRVDFEGTFGRWTSGNVKFSFSTLSEAISGITYYYSTDGVNWIEITTGDEILLNENTNATYVFKAVNGAGVESNPSDSYKVMIDNVAPSIQFTPEKTEFTTEPYDIALNIAFGEAGLNSVSVNGVDITGQDKLTVSENGTYVFVMTGNNGLTSTEVLKVENFISYEIKVTNIDFSSENGFANYFNEPFGKYFSENVTVSMDASCNDGSIGKIEYRLLDENGNPTGEWTVYDSENKPVIDANFKGSVEARAYDTTGTKMSEIVKSEGITVDFIAPTAPVISATANGEEYTGEWTNGEIEAALSSTAYSSVYEYYYRIDGGEWQKLSGNTVTLKDVGEHNYEFKAVSKANLESAVSKLSTKFENAAPALAIAVDGTIGHRTYDDVTFTLSSPNTISGITYYYNLGEGWVEMEDDTVEINTTCDNTYAFKAVNGAGVESYQSPSYRVIVDKNYLLVEKKPILNVTVSGTAGEWTSNSVLFTLTSTECEGEVTYYYDNGNGWQAMNSNILAVTSLGTETYKFKAVDETGRESTESAEYSVMLDTVAPNVSVALDDANFTNSTRTAAVTAMAGISGIKSITVNGTDITESESFTVNENGKYTVTVVANNGLSATTVLTVASFDYEAPDVTDITMEHKNNGGFARFINAITFGLFFNEEIEVTVSAEDTGASGLDRIEYRLLDANGTAISEWLTYNEADKPTVDVEFKGYVEARAVDKAGNTSPVLTSRGFVVDTENPANIAVTATVDGAEYDGTFTSQDVVLTPSATAFSDIHSYMYKVDNGEWNVMTTESIVALDGVHTYSFKAVSNANLESDTVSVTTKVEKGTPELTVNVAGATDSWTSADVVFTLSSTNGNSGTTYYYNNGKGWQAMDSNVLTVSENVNAEYSFKAVNGAGTESSVSDSYIVMLDKTVPEISVTPNETDFTNKDVTLDVKVTDNSICGVAGTKVNGDALNADKYTVSENGTYMFTVTLNNGNKASYIVTVSNIDKEAPAVTEINTGKENSVVNSVKIYGDETTVTITAEDTGVSGIAKIEYRAVNTEKLLAKMGINGFWKEYDANDKPVLEDNFKGYVEVRVTDNAGNVSEILTSADILVDTKAPEIKAETAYNGEWTKENIEFVLTGEADSDIAYYMIKADSGEWTDLDTDTFTASKEGTHTYGFKAVSNAGHESEAVYFDTSIEKTAPVTEISVFGTVGEWTTGAVSFVLKTENALSGVKYYYDNGNGWTEIHGDTLTVTADINAEYTFKTVNGAGVESVYETVYKVMKDSVLPTVKAEYSEHTPNDALTIPVEITTGISGIKAVTVDGQDITESESFTVNENGKYTVTVVANNGLSATTVLTVASFDYEAPDVTDITMEHKNNGGFARFINAITFGLFFNEEIEVTVSAEDTGASGLDRIEYRLLDANGTAISEWLTYNEADKPTVDVEFKGYVEARAVDKAGNTSPVLTSRGFVVDTENPANIAVTATVDGAEYDGTFTSQDVVLTPSATAFSDIHSYMYKVDNGEWNVMTTESIVALDGVHTYSFKAVSNANLESDTVSVTTKVEKGTPELTVNVAGATDSWTSADVVFTLSSTNGNSGTTYYYNNGKGWQAMDSNVLTVSENVNAEYSFKAVNGAGTESLVSDSYIVMLDKTVPEVLSMEVLSNGKSFENGAILTNGVTITLSARSNSGIAKYQYSLNGGEWVDMESDTIKVTEEGFYSYCFRAVSNSGTVSEMKQIAFTYDKDYNPNNYVTGVNIPNTEVITTVSASLVPVVIAAALILIKKKNKDENND